MYARGERVLTIRAAGDGMTVVQRAYQVSERLEPILFENHFTAADIHTESTRGNRINIMVKNRLLVTVLPEDARARGETQTLILAQIWVAHLQSVLPRLSALPNQNK